MQKETTEPSEVWAGNCPWDKPDTCAVCRRKVGQPHKENCEYNENAD